MIILSALALLKCACTACLRNDEMMQSAICGIGNKLTCSSIWDQTFLNLLLKSIFFWDVFWCLWWEYLKVRYRDMIIGSWIKKLFMGNYDPIQNIPIQFHQLNCFTCSNVNMNLCNQCTWRNSQSRIFHCINNEFDLHNYRAETYETYVGQQKLNKDNWLNWQILTI